MTFPTLTCSMIPVMSDIGDIPDDLNLNYDDECFYFRVPIAESDDGRWLTSIDAGYQEWGTGLFRPLVACFENRSGLI
jgi:hypothetical protein